MRSEEHCTILHLKKSIYCRRVKFYISLRHIRCRISEECCVGLQASEPGPERCHKQCSSNRIKPTPVRVRKGQIMCYRKSQWGRPFKDSWKRFLYLSAFGWGCPLVLTTTCALVFKRYDALKLYSKEGVVYYSGPWYRPSLIETRTCFNEIHHRKDLKGGSSKYGSLLFYYTPILALVIANVVCLGSTAKNIRLLSRGNSILRRDELINHNEIGNYSGGDDGGRSSNGTKGASGEKIRGAAGNRTLTHADAQSILVYLKLLLAAGALEFLTEAITWATSGFHGVLSSLLPSDEETSMFDHTFILRTVGYFVDIFRACGVLWLVFPKSRRAITPFHLPPGGQTTWYSAT